MLTVDVQANEDDKSKLESFDIVDTTPSVQIDNSQTNKLLYGVDDVPPWYLCIFLGLQQSFTGIAGAIELPIILHESVCMGDDTVGLSEWIGTALFTTGLATMMQSFIGIRLPIVQGTTVAFLMPVFALMSQPDWKCPTNVTQGIENSTLPIPEVGNEKHREMWQTRLSVVSGSLMVASLFQMILGVTGMIGFLLRFIGPITICAVTSSIGLSLFPLAASYSSEQWYIALSVIFFVTLFSQFLKRWKFFTIFPVILSIGLGWLLCFVLTYTGVLTDQKDGWGYTARTDIKSSVIWKTSWIRIPYPGQFGLPMVNIAGVCGMLAGVIASVLESVGDYYACAMQTGAGRPPSHAINRGVAVEGLGCFLCGLWGSGIGTTSYSENIAAINITRVGSRRVVLVAGLILVILGCLGKVSAIFVTIPHPVLGGLFHVTFGMVMTVGLTYLQFVDMSSPRNIFVIGIAICTGQTIPTWLNQNQSSINTGSPILDQIISVILGTHMFVAGLIACLLDNIVPGTQLERGFTRWKKSTVASFDHTGSRTVYGLPYIQQYLDRFTWPSYIPVCPAFKAEKNQDI
ncbi:solute carrier family 23 member 1-like [Saccostrea echinata]|uniref:solute carrier family 23 member 1-like n=1 Tax=Saccostrea echinata TaxID=191078 RepID=UPI002A7EF8B9|nr:solute carrier family 23 member 1-like [Saccostrea echinata]